MNLNLIFDGGNGASLEKEAYGSFKIWNDDVDIFGQVSFGTGFTNNQAEYKTLISALEYIIEHFTIAGNVSHIDLAIEGDSELVRCQIGELKKKVIGKLIGTDIETYIPIWTGWKVNVEHLLPLRDTARGLLVRFNSFDYRHIPRKKVVAVLGH